MHRPNNSTSHKLVKSDIGTPSFMRAPGEAPGTYGLEAAMDELAYALKMDPIEFRLKNYAETDPEENKPWSSKSLRDCYRMGAERFGWSKRSIEPRSMREPEGHELIGWGMATAVYPTRRSASNATARLNADGTFSVDAGTQDLGTGTYTIMTQIAADSFGVPPNRVKFRLGDTELPQTPCLRRISNRGEYRFSSLSCGASSSRKVNPDGRQRFTVAAVRDQRAGRRVRKWTSVFANRFFQRRNLPGVDRQKWAASRRSPGERQAWS